MKNIFKKLVPLFLFSMINCYAQQSSKFFTYPENKFLKPEFLLKDLSLEDKVKKPFLNIPFSPKSTDIKIEETIYNLNLPLLNETKWLLNLYYTLLNDYRKFKRFRDSFASYELINNEHITTKLYLINFRNFKNVNDYELLLSLKIRFF